MCVCARVCGNVCMCVIGRLGHVCACNILNKAIVFERRLRCVSNNVGTDGVVLFMADVLETATHVSCDETSAAPEETTFTQHSFES